MRQVFSANDFVQLSYAEAVLKAAGIAVERTEPEATLYQRGPREPIPGRLWVDESDFDNAVVALREAFKDDVIK